MTIREIQGVLAEMYGVEASPDLISLWIEQTEGAKFWLNVFTDLKRADARTSSVPSPMASQA